MCLAGFSVAATAEDRFVYLESTASAMITINVEAEENSTGSILHVDRSDGDVYDITCDRQDATTSCGYSSPATRTAYGTIREGNAILMSGTLKGSPVSRTIAIDGRPWYEFPERSLCLYAISSSHPPISFWILLPSDGNAFLLMARWEGPDEIEVNGRKVMAIRVRVSLTGLLSIFWGTYYWYDATDGTFLKYKGVRGLPGSPETTVELIWDGRVSP